MSAHDVARANLKLANGLRSARKQLKDRVHGDPEWRELEAIILGRDNETAAGMTVIELLDTAPGVGPNGARRWLLTAGIRIPLWGELKLGDLGEDERRELARVVRSSHRTRNITTLRRIAAKPRLGRHYESRNRKDPSP